MLLFSLGLKEAEEEVEKFVQSNTQEVAKDKWQCPLCGKKFKGAEYVHKHILIKHAEKVKEVKKEVSYCFAVSRVFQNFFAFRKNHMYSYFDD